MALVTTTTSDQFWNDNKFDLTLPLIIKTTNVGATSENRENQGNCSQQPKTVTLVYSCFPVVYSPFDFIDGGRQTGAVHGRKSEREL